MLAQWASVCQGVILRRCNDAIGLGQSTRRRSVYIEKDIGLGVRRRTGVDHVLVQQLVGRGAVLIVIVPQHADVVLRGSVVPFLKIGVFREENRVRRTVSVR